MPSTLEIGQRIRNYTIKKVFAPGAMAMSAQATTDSGEVVFFKRYKLPTVRLKWYRGYVEYETEIHKRIKASEFEPFTCRLIDCFEEDNCYHQVFELLEGDNLEQKLDSGRMDWKSRMTFAKTFMHAMTLLHEINIIHSDLKPSQLFCVPAEKTRSGFMLKIADMDFAILEDIIAPWDGIEGYIGTPMYYSPEHMRGEKPTKKSDVFTCSLILHELLCKDAHPYQVADNDEYKENILANTAKEPVLLGSFGSEAKNMRVVKMLREALDPIADKRPTAKEMSETLNFCHEEIPIPINRPKIKSTPRLYPAWECTCSPTNEEESSSSTTKGE